jgi:hypothetical protein
VLFERLLYDGELRNQVDELMEGLLQRHPGEFVESTIVEIHERIAEWLNDDLLDAW